MKIFRYVYGRPEFVFLICVSFITRFWNLGVPNWVVFDEVLLKGIWPPPDNTIMFNGTVLKVESVASHTGLLIDEKGARGPVLKLVNCKVAE